MNLIKNALGRWVPDEIPGFGRLSPYESPDVRLNGTYTFTAQSPIHRVVSFGRQKITRNIREAIERSGLKSGMTISFHHHLRNGDAVLPFILKEIAAMGIRDLTLASSSLTGAHDCVADYIRSGVITGLYSSGVRGAVGQAVSRGELAKPLIIHSHGGRARLMKEGKLRVDVAFLGAPACDHDGNFLGSEGPSACGSLGYALSDAQYAAHVVAVTDNLVSDSLEARASVNACQVDQILVVDSLGDPNKIASGTVRFTRDPLQQRMAELAFGVMKASGLVAPGYSYQAGAGGASLAVTAYLESYAKKNSIRGSFALGGVSGHTINMLKENLFDRVLDVQSFDAAVAQSLSTDPRHIEISAARYADPFCTSCAVNQLDIVALAALDVDVDFNVDVMTGLDGVLRGASGGHSDTAYGAKLAMVLVPTQRSRVPAIREKVQTVVTPGSTVDCIITERGVCINPNRSDLEHACRKAGLPVRNIHDLRHEVLAETGTPDDVKFSDKIVGVVEYRDGTVIDTLHSVETNN